MACKWLTLALKIQTEWRNRKKYFKIGVGILISNKLDLKTQRAHYIIKKLIKHNCYKYLCSQHWSIQLYKAKTTKKRTNSNMILFGDSTTHSQQCINHPDRDSKGNSRFSEIFPHNGQVPAAKLPFWCNRTFWVLCSIIILWLLLSILMSIFVPGTTLYTSHGLSHLILARILKGKYLDNPSSKVRKLTPKEIKQITQNYLTPK